MSEQYPREPVPEEAANRPARTVGMIVSNAVRRSLQHQGEEQRSK